MNSSFYQVNKKINNENLPKNRQSWTKSKSKRFLSFLDDSPGPG